MPATFCNMELPKRKQNRLPSFDYCTPGAYFVTLCTENRKNLFWSDVGAINDRPQDVPLTPYGQIVDHCINDIPKHYPAVSVDHYVIMPDHIHLLLQVQTDPDGRSMIAPTISSVMRQMKGAAVKQCGTPLWQKGFYDHVIRNEQDYLDCWQYIEANPQKKTLSGG